MPTAFPDTPLSLTPHNYTATMLQDSTAHTYTSHFSSLSPKGTMPMSTDPVLGSNGSQITGASEIFDERLLHYREVEEVFGNLQDIVMENYLDSAEGKSNVSFWTDRILLYRYGPITNYSCSNV